MADLVARGRRSANIGRFNTPTDFYEAIVDADSANPQLGGEDSVQINNEGLYRRRPIWPEDIQWHHSTDIEPLLPIAYAGAAIERPRRPCSQA